MLDGARDPHGKVQLRVHHFARLTDLMGMRSVTGIHRRTRCANRPSDDICQSLKELKILLAL